MGLEIRLDDRKLRAIVNEVFGLAQELSVTGVCAEHSDEANPKSRSVAFLSSGRSTFSIA